MRGLLRTALVAGFAAAAMVWPGTAVSDIAADPGLRYVALGDSRAAGPNLDPAAFLNGCARADVGYPGLVAQALRPMAFTNVACTGARTAHVTSVPQQTSTGPVAPQIDALTPDADLVTISIGGNDLGWSSLVSSCYTDLPGGDAQCRNDPGTAARMKAGLDALGPKVGSTLSTIRQRAPHARVMLVGHGGIFDNRGCWPNIPTSNFDAAFITEFFARANSVLARTAANAGAEFVDVSSGASGHDACALPGQNWYEGLYSLSLAKPLHPTAAGMSHMAQRVLDTWYARR
jgi:lysophospholipase L1-like esterase